MANHPNNFNAQSCFTSSGQDYDYFSLNQAQDSGLKSISRLPFSLKIILENLLRFEDGVSVKAEDIKALSLWVEHRGSKEEIAYRPSRVLMQDFTGVPAIADLAAMRDVMVEKGGDPQKINPLVPVDLVIDHSLMVDAFGSPQAKAQNIKREYERNGERYAFLRWAADAFDNFRVVPPGIGICHQVNLEYIGKIVMSAKKDGRNQAWLDSVVGTDSHTTMINALGILGWGVGGIEAEAALLGQPISMLLPEVIGVHLDGQAQAGVTATDIVLAITQTLRAKGVVGKFVEFFGDGLGRMAVEDRATIANMSPEYGATCGFFPVDSKTLDYMSITGRTDEHITLVKDYLVAQGLFLDASQEAPLFSDIVKVNLSVIEPSLAGPKRPQDKILLKNMKTSFSKIIADEPKPSPNTEEIKNGDIVIAAITSCTNTSNPRVMLGAGLIARNALQKGLMTKKWVKTSLAPGSQVVSHYLQASQLQNDLDAQGFQIVGYGCTTCIGNSGPLDKVISKTIKDNDLTVAAILSGNRNFEGRIHADVKANYLASPMLVVAYALAGSVLIDLTKDPLGKDKDGQDVYLKDIWPSDEDISQMVAQYIHQDMFRSSYKDIFKGDSAWNAIIPDKGAVYPWFDASTYVRKPPFVEKTTQQNPQIQSARILALLEDSITTDHISPAGAIAPDSPAAQYLEERQISPREFNSYGARRGNHEVMMRGTFANIRLRNQIAPETEGGQTKLFTNGQAENMTIFAAAQHYIKSDTPLVVIAGKEYGTGSSRDWAAKGPRLLGVKAVIAESFERIHRSNLVGMGIIPLQFQKGESWKKLKLIGSEKIDINIPDHITPKQEISATIHYDDGQTKTLSLLCRIDTENEVDYHKSSGILPYVLDRLATK